MKELKDLKLKNISDLKEMEEKALKTELKKSSENLFVLRMKKDLGEIKQTHLIRTQRKYIARMKTVANSKGIKL